MRRSSSSFAFFTTSVLFAALAGCGSVQETPDASDDDVDGGVVIDAMPIDTPIDGTGNVTLTVVRGGSGTGTVTSNPSGLNCGGTCNLAVPMGTLVTLTAAPDANNTFSGWGGACSGSLTTCSFTINADTVVNANFAVAMRTVTIAISGNGTGTVTSSVGGINCPGTCTATVPHGTSMILTGTPTGGSSIFLGWSGGSCTGTGTCALTVTADVTITAPFALNQTLVVTRGGNGNGTVTSSPAGINCGNDCNETYATGTVVTLTAAAAGDSDFSGWSGGGCSGTGTCVVTVNAAVGVTATFTLRQYTFTVNHTGTGTGTTTSSPAGITCPGACARMFDHGTVLTLTATPTAPASQFGGWSGGGCSGTGTCVVTLTGPTTVTADYDPATYTLTVAKAGNGAGTVTSSPAGVSCGADCSEAYNYNTNVTLTATAATAPISSVSSFIGWSGACSGTGACTVTMSQARNVTATFDLRPNTVFITSTTTNGNMGGLAGADAICQGRANTVGLTGTYRAWLSSTTANANTRLGTASGWVRTDGKPFANTQQQVFDSKFFYPPRFDEAGTDVFVQGAMTATTTGGVLQNGNDCSGWTSTTGSVTSGNSATSGYQWTVSGTTSCSNTMRIYCFGIDRAASVSVPAVAGTRKAFMRLWTPGGGIASADSACATAATTAGLSGSYKALLPTIGATALSRFNLNGGNWVRVDNAAVLPTASAWANATFFDTTPNLAADGGMTYGNYLNWAGATTFSTAGTAASTCNNWTDTAMTAQTGNANVNQISSFWSTGTYQCNFTSATIVCLQE